MKPILILVCSLLFCSQVNAQKATLIESCESEKGWTGSQPVTIDQSDVKEGKAALKSEGIGPFRFRTAYTTPVNTGLDGKSGFLGFWYYVSSVEAVEANPGMIMISSSGKGELNSHLLPLKSLKLQKGWNKVALELSAATSKGGEFDGSKMNYFMLIQKTADPVVLKIDGIRFAKESKDLF